MLFLSSTFLSEGYSQVTDSLVKTKIAELEKIWLSHINDATVNFKQKDIPQTQLLLTNMINYGDTAWVNINNSLYNARINQLKNDVGVDFNTNYIENFNTGINTEDDLIYRRRLQTGLEWDILKNGYYASKLKQQQLQNELLIQTLQNASQVSSSSYVKNASAVIYLYNAQKISLLEKRLTIVNQQLKFANDLNKLKQIPYIEVMRVVQSQTDIAAMLQVYKGYNDLLAAHYSSFKTDEIYPLCDIDVNKLLQSHAALKTNALRDSIVNLEIKNLDLESSFINNIGLRTALRYNLFDPFYVEGNQRDFFSASLSVTMPIPFGTKSAKKVNDAKAKLLQYNNQHNNNDEFFSEAVNGFYEYRYKLKQYVNFYQKTFIYKELIRIDKVKQQFQDVEFNPLKALTVIDDYLSIQIEMLDLRQQMLIQLLKMSVKYPEVQVQNIIKPFSLDSLAIKANFISANLSVYTWSDALANFKPSFLSNYVMLNKISAVILSYKKNGSNAEQVNLFFDSLLLNGVNVELLVGNNKLTAKNFKRSIDSLIALTKGRAIAALHLDVEPHTFDDFKQNEGKYMDAYIEMLKNAKAYCTEKNIKLNASIPVYFKEKYLTAIYSLCDKIYLMTYETTKAESVVNRIKEELILGKSKTVIAIRTNDFANRNELDEMIKKLQELTGVFDFAIHDLDSMIKQDNK